MYQARFGLKLLSQIGASFINRRFLIPMLIVLYGPDTYRSRQKLKEIIANYHAKHKSGLNFTQREWAEGSLEELSDVLSSTSMFDEKKLVVIKNACLATKSEQEKLVDLIKKKKTVKDNDVIVVFYESEKPEKSDLFSWLKKEAQMAQEFDFLSGTKLKNWVQKEVATSGGKISVSATDTLAAFVGADLWQMTSEINKLVNYKNGGMISQRDVELLVKSKYDPNIFATIDALAARNKNLAYKLLHQHLSQGENEIYILSMFVYQFRNLLQIKNLVEQGIPSIALAKKTGVHPFVIKKSWPQLKNFNLEALKKIYEHLLKLDIAIKRGRIEPSVALDLIVGEIAG